MLLVFLGELDDNLIKPSRTAAGLLPTTNYEIALRMNQQASQRCAAGEQATMESRPVKASAASLSLPFGRRQNSGNRTNTRVKRAFFWVGGYASCEH
jgi:hypothetical protein